ncbi:MAG: radical SAM/SPASM domain-containing protein [Acidobacteriota bacterium]
MRHVLTERTVLTDHDIGDLITDPYLHIGDDRLYNPLTDRLLKVGEKGYADLRRILEGTPVAALDASLLDPLVEDGWLVQKSKNLDERFRLKFVSLEAHTICNQRCYFCPVSINPRRAYFMPTEQYEDILRQVSAYRDTIEGVFMINYNEPTFDKRFLDQVRAIMGAGLPPAVLTNGTGLTEERIDALVEMGGIGFLCINMSTLDQERYKRDRGTGNVARILQYLDHAKNLPVAKEMKIIVLGTGNDVHKRDFEEMKDRFAGSRFKVESYEVMDRAGYLQIGLKAAHHEGRQLCGCDNVGSRPIQHLHITPHAKVVLCCEDYDEHHVVGDLNKQTLHEVLTGPAMQLMRRWIYGIEEAPSDFICRNCVFAQSRERA